MLQNAYFLAKIGADTAENEQHFAEILPTDALWRGRPAGDAGRREVSAALREDPDAFDSIDHRMECASIFCQTSSFPTDIDEHLVEKIHEYQILRIIIMFRYLRTISLF